MHIYPGQYQVFDETYFWDDESTAKFVKIIEMYPDRVMMMLGAHTHYGDIRINLPTSNSKGGFWNTNEEPVAKYSMLATPSYSLSNYNNPGFTTFKVRNNSARDIKFTFMEAHKFPQDAEEATYNELDFTSELGLDEWSHENAQKVISKLENSWIGFFRYLGHKIGFHGFLNIYGFFTHYLLGSVGFFTKTIFLCSSRHVNKEDFHNCIN